MAEEAAERQQTSERARVGAEIAALAARVREGTGFVRLISKPCAQWTADEQSYAWSVLMAFQMAAWQQRL